MRKIKLTFIFVLAFVSVNAESAHAETFAEKNLRAAVSEACAVTKNLSEHAPATCRLNGIDRRHIADDIFEYSFLLKVGAGEHDVIKVHRVVRERWPGVPRRTKQSVFMVHGDTWGFDAAFLGSTLSDEVPREQSIGVFLARNNVDVWGIDLRWVQVPTETTDFTFMKDWNTQTHIRDLSVALGVARTVRWFTGSGFGKVTLLGWSRGGVLAYAYANEETRLPGRLRHVRAMIPVDIAFKFSPEHEEQRSGACRRYNTNKQILDSGQYQTNGGAALKTFGLLAATAPEALSPIIPGLTNRQAALVVGTATYTGGPDPAVPFFHFNAGTFNEFNLPTGLQFTREAYLYDFFQTAAPFQSFTEFVEGEAIFCNEVDVPYDDHLSDITIPVLYVGAEGGFGSFGTYTLSLLGSTDVDSHIVQLYPPESRAIEFGHVDLFLADNAEELVWRPVYDWITTH